MCVWMFVGYCWMFLRRGAGRESKLLNLKNNTFFSTIPSEHATILCSFFLFLRAVESISL